MSGVPGMGLVREFARDDCEAAFAKLVGCHMNLVI
jgi:hypothetical protein